MKTTKNRVIDYDGLALIDKSSVIEDITINLDVWKDTPILLNIATLKSMSSGTCIIPPDQENPIAVCKEGKDIKIFRIFREENRSLLSDRVNVVTIEE